MIADKITNLKQYPLFQEDADRILRFIEKDRKENLKDGRYDLDGDRLFASVQSYESKNLSEGRIEAHEMYCDLQYIVKGEEYIYYSPLDTLELIEDRRPGEDIVFYDGKGGKSRTHLTEGMFGFYSPADGHMPGIAVNGTIPMKKIVFKIRVQ